MPELAELDDLLRDDQRLKTWTLFLESYRRVLDTLDDELKDKQGLSLAWFDVLAQLFNTSGTQAANEPTGEQHSSVQKRAHAPGRQDGG